MRRGEERYRALSRKPPEGVSRLEIDPPLAVTMPEDEQIDGLYAGAQIAECNDAMARITDTTKPRTSSAPASPTS